MVAQVDMCRILSQFQIDEVNGIIEKVECLCRIRGIHTETSGLFYENPWRITVAFHDDKGWGMIIHHNGREVFCSVWPRNQEHGHLALFEPGAWRAELLAKPLYDA